jgi:hypothetical protein
VAGHRNWTLELARHDAHVRSAHPTDRLLVVSELDGPIVDQRHIVRRRLLDYDRVHGTNHFSGVELAEVDVDAGNLERFITVKDFRRRVRGRSSIGAGSGLRRRSTGPARCVPIPAHSR